MCRMQALPERRGTLDRGRRLDAAAELAQHARFPEPEVAAVPAEPRTEQLRCLAVAERGQRAVEIARLLARTAEDFVLQCERSAAVVAAGFVDRDPARDRRECLVRAPDLQPITRQHRKVARILGMFFAPQ